MLTAACLLFGAATVPAQPRRGRPTTITLSDVKGKQVRPLEGSARRATLLFFIAHDCPISNAYAPEVARICNRFAPRGVVSYVVYVEQDLKPADARKHARDFRYPCPALMDPKRQLVRRTGARMTPEAVLLAPSGKAVYRGRIDDTYVAYGKRRDEPATRNLRNAIEAYLAGKPVSPSRTPVVGCYIPDVPEL